MSDHDSTESDELTVEDQNQSNADTDDIRSLLSNFTQAKEETLEDLVGGLMFLTMDDIRNSNNPSVVSALKQDPHSTAADSQLLKGGNRVMRVGTEGRVVVPESVTGTAQSCNAGLSGSTNSGDTEEIEEEILDESVCTRQTNQDRLLRHRPASLTKFDNFILSTDDSASDTESNPGRAEEEEGDDWLVASGYTASFASGNTTSTQESETPPDTAPQSQTASEYRVDKDSSDSIIPSFQHTPNVNSSTPETAADDGSLSDSRKDAINSKTLDLECDDSSRDCETDVEAPTWALNPGEVEDEEKMGVPAVTQSMTVMEFSTKVVSLDGSGAAAEHGSQEDAEDCSDEVVPFALDEEFDYDTVVYTPKFSQAEINYLTSFLPQSS